MKTSLGKWLAVLVVVSSAPSFAQETDDMRAMAKKLKDSAVAEFKRFSFSCVYPGPTVLRVPVPGPLRQFARAALQRVIVRISKQTLVFGFLDLNVRTAF